MLALDLASEVAYLRRLDSVHMGAAVWIRDNELTGAIDFVTSFADDLFTEHPVELPTNKE
jgi:hypothetical protein